MQVPHMDCKSIHSTLHARQMCVGQPAEIQLFEKFPSSLLVGTLDLKGIRLGFTWQNYASAFRWKDTDFQLVVLTTTS